MMKTVSFGSSDNSSVYMCNAQHEKMIFTSCADQHVQSDLGFFYSSICFTTVNDLVGD